MTRIRRISREGVSGILRYGTPEGYWFARSEKAPWVWVGAVAEDGQVRHLMGTLGEVLAWLTEQGGGEAPEEGE